MRGGFRPGEDLQAESVPSEPAGLSFTRAADAGGTDLDVLMGYQIFLGRDPESSFVIADAKSSPVGAFIRALMSSGEFQSSVLDRLDSGRRLPHEASAIRPSPEQTGWLFRHIRLPARVEADLRSTSDWTAWLRLLVAVPGFPHAPERGLRPDPAANGLTPVEAGEGFVLIHLEQPKPDEKLHPGGLVSGSGWAIAPADIAEIGIYLDEQLLTHARYGLPRPDVARNFPHYRHVDHCGFAFTAEIPMAGNIGADSRLIIAVRTERGDHGRKAIRLQAPADPSATGAEPGVASAAAAGAPEPWPIRLAVEEADIGADRVLRVRGWAASRLAMRSVSATLGDVALGEAKFGMPRPDIGRAHPSYGNAALSGFALMWPVPDDLAPGPSFVRVQAADQSGQARQTIVPVVVPPRRPKSGADAAVPEQASPIRCSCDLARLTASGRLSVGGWAMAPGGITGIEIEFDGIVVGDAVTGRPRPDVAAEFPDEPQAAAAGFEFTHTLPQPPGAGEHLVVLRIAGTAGEQRLMDVALSLGPAAPAATVGAAAQAADIRLEIDRPVLDSDSTAEPVHGALTISGWAVARGGVAGVSVFCDDRLLGRTHLGMRREDIGAAFPDYEGSLRAGYALVLPPGVLPAGTHAIRVVAEAKSGRSVERRFALAVEAYDALPPGGTIRLTIPPAEAEFALLRLDRLGFRPLFDIVVAPGDEAGLAATLAALAAQAYPDWIATLSPPYGTSPEQLIVADPAGRIRMAETGAGPPRRRIGAAKARATGGVAEAVAEGSDRPPRFVLRLRAGDRLGCDALLELACELAARPETDFLFADELREDVTQGRRQPFFKPDWSPELLLGLNYPGRAWCAAERLLPEAGLDIADLRVLTDFDAVLRLTEQAAAIGHAARVLFERGQAGDTPDQESAALERALSRRRITGQVEPGRAPGTWRVRRAIDRARPRKPKSSSKTKMPGLISVIMPTCSARNLVRTAIKTIRANSAPTLADGRAVEIVILDNTPARNTRARSWLKKNADLVIDMPGPFNWSRFNNVGARAAGGDYLLFLNDDIEVREPGWLDAMLEQAQRPEVGVVGARLLYPDGKVQHGGQYLADTHARHAFRFADAASPGPFGIAAVAREMMSVTGACQMMHRRTFEALGGFEEAHSVVNNDLDFCLKSWRAGLAVMFTPHTTLIHHELASRADLEDSFDEARFTGSWRTRFLAGDPFRSRHLGPDLDHDGPDPEPAAFLHAGRRGPSPAAVRRILAVKLDHIGDFLTALPALRSLRRRFPDASIDLLAPAATAELARHHDMIAEAIVFDFFHARSGEGRKGVGDAEFQALRARLAPARYDLAIDLRMQPETRAVLPYTGAAFLAGYDHDNRFPWLDVALEWEGDERLVGKRAHISERLVQLVAAVEVACRAEPAAADLPRLAVRDVAALAALPAGFTARPIICVHPGVGNVVRQWPAAHYAGLIDLLAESGFNTVLIGAPEEAPIAEMILRLVGAVGAAESLVGRVKLGQLPDVMRACVLFVGNNSGPQHLAASVGLPTIGIHSGVVDAAEWAPLGRQALAIRRRMICGPCYLEFAADCPRGLACLTGLRPRDVFEACRRLLPPSGQAGGPKSLAKPVGPVLNPRD